MQNKNLVLGRVGGKKRKKVQLNRIVHAEWDWKWVLTKIPKAAHTSFRRGKSLHGLHWAAVIHHEMKWAARESSTEFMYPVANSWNKQE